MTDSNYQIDSKILETALDAARTAGRLIARNQDKVKRVDHKGVIDLVTEVDLLSEEQIIGIIKKDFPQHQIVAEEGGGGEERSDYIWWIDPLDGTTNFVHGYPHYAVSIALEFRGEITLGIVYDPIREELFSAVKGEGASLNRAPLAVSSIRSLERSLLATGFPYDRDQQTRALSLFDGLLSRVQGIRRDGSAALNLAYVAAGRLDGFWELGLRPWDTAAGVLLVKEAGGAVSNFQGGPFDIRHPEIIAGNRFIQRLMVEAIESGGGDRD